MTRPRAYGLGTARRTAIGSATVAMVVALFVLTPMPVRADAAEAAPEEPAIVLPTVVLEIDDLAAPQVRAGLPAEDELLPPERVLPLPDPDDFPVSVPLANVGFGTNQATGATSPALAGDRFAIQSTLGAGSSSFVSSSVAVTSLGSGPRFRLAFAHDVLDGYGQDHPPGTGFAERSDQIEGSLESPIGAARLSGEASYLSEETGLQGRTDYEERTLRRIHAQATVEIGFGQRGTARATIAGRAAELTLSAATAERKTEFTVEPEIAADIDFAGWNLGARGDYSVQYVPDDSTYTVQRGYLGLHTDIELPAQLSAGADVGVRIAVDPVSATMPFELRVSGTPVAPLSFRLTGGRKAVPHSLDELHATYPFVAPVALADGEVWYGAVAVQGSIGGRLSVNGGAEVESGDGFIDPDADALTSGTYAGLHDVATFAGTRITPRAGLRWQLGSAVDLSFDWQSVLGDRPTFTPVHRLTGGVAVGRAAGAGGPLSADATVLFDVTGTELGTLLPTLDVNVGYRASEVVTIVAGLRDLLWPLLDDGRSTFGAYKDPGIRGSLAAAIEL